MKYSNFIILSLLFILAGCGGGGGGGDPVPVPEVIAPPSDFEAVSGVEIDKIKAGFSVVPRPVERVYLASQEVFIDTYGLNILSGGLFSGGIIRRIDDFGNAIPSGAEITFLFIDPQTFSTTVIIRIKFKPEIFINPNSDTGVSFSREYFSGRFPANVLTVEAFFRKLNKKLTG